MMKKKELLSMLFALFTWCNVNAQNTLYARTNGNWNDDNATTGTWSTIAPGGAPCNCTPNDNDSTVIDGFNVFMPNTATTRDLTITSGSSLALNNNATLIINNEGTVNLKTGGSITHSGATSNARFRFISGSPSIIVEPGFSFSLDDIIIEDTVSLTMSGSGNLTLTNDFSFEGSGSTIINNTTGNLVVNRDIWFESGFSGNRFINNGHLSINDDITLKGISNGLINNDSIILADDVSFIGTACYLNNNLTGVILCDDDISFSTTTDCKVVNIGDFLIRGQGVGGIVYEGLRDTIVNSGTMRTLLSLKVLSNNYDDNVFINTTGATLSVLEDFELNDADFIFDNSGTFNLTGRLRDMAGDERFFNRSGAVVNYYGSHGASVNTELSLFANFDANYFNYLSASSQDVIVPQDAYWNLTLGGNGIKEAQGNLDINGDILITGSATFSVSTNNYNLSVAGNWTCSSIFIEGNGLVTFDGSLDQSINTASGQNFYDWVINKSVGKVTLHSDVNISNVLTLMAGACDLNSNTLTIQSQNTAAILRANGYLISEQDDNSSKVVRNIGTTFGSFLFPFGTANGTYIPFFVESTTGDFGMVTVSTYATGSDNLPWPTTPNVVMNLDGVNGATPDNRDNTIDRFWQIDKTGSSGTANLTFGYAQSEVSGNVVASEGLLEAQRYNVGTNMWEPAITGQVTDAANNSVRVNGVSSFSPWTLAISNAPLPITLVDFDAQLIDDKVELTWVTSTQINNDYFTLEKSRDAKIFSSFAKIAGAGTSNNLINYYEMDYEVEQGTTYYRLKQTDFNGDFTYSNVIPINKSETQLSFTTYPNPTTWGNLHLKITDAKDEELQMTIRDMTGKECYHKLISLEEGQKDFLVQPDIVLPAGSYVIIGETTNRLYSAKFIITN